jgi:hypothetical protein
MNEMACKLCGKSSWMDLVEMEETSNHPHENHDKNIGRKQLGEKREV